MYITLHSFITPSRIIIISSNLHVLVFYRFLLSKLSESKSFEMKSFLRKLRRQKRSKTQATSVSELGQIPEKHLVPQRANLEGIAFEIQQAILNQMPDILTLKALISASPSYLRVYRSQRLSILSNILLRDIHPDVLFDALVVLNARDLPRNYDDYVPQLKAFTEQYKITRTSLHVGLEPLEPSIKEILWEFHLAVIDVTKDFCDYALSTHPVTGHGSDHCKPLSPNEVRRIHRAFYRYELFNVPFRESDLYHEEQYRRRRNRDPDKLCLALQRDSIMSLDSDDKLILFLTLFTVWDVEEIACVHEYLINRCDELYKEYKLELQEAMEGKSDDDSLSEGQNIED